jgi:hypothetical protein
MVQKFKKSNLELHTLLYTWFYICTTAEANNNNDIRNLIEPMLNKKDSRTNTSR